MNRSGSMSSFTRPTSRDRTGNSVFRYELLTPMTVTSIRVEPFTGLTSFLTIKGHESTFSKPFSTQVIYPEELLHVTTIGIYWHLLLQLLASIGYVDQLPLIVNHLWGRRRAAEVSREAQARMMEEIEEARAHAEKVLALRRSS